MQNAGSEKISRLLSQRDWLIQRLGTIRTNKLWYCMQSSNLVSAYLKISPN